MFGDALFQNASPQFRVKLTLYRLGTEVETLLTDPNPLREERVKTASSMIGETTEELLRTYREHPVTQTPIGVFQV